MDAGTDMGIGLLGLKSESGEPQTVVKGLKATRTGYGEAMQKALNGLELRRQPSELHPMVGRFAFTEDGRLGVQNKDGFYPVAESGVELGNGTVGLVTLQRQGAWVQVVVHHTPRTTGWIRLDSRNPMQFWLWYRYFEGVVKAKLPVIFTTPVRDDMVYHPHFKSLSPIKNIFQLEDAVLYPEKLDGAYMLVRLGQAAGCPSAATPQFEKPEPLHAWIKWLQNDGRPRVFRYFQPPCH